MTTRSSQALKGLIGDIKVASSPFRNYLVELHARHAGNHDGAVADYIPELTKADPNWWGIAVCTADGRIFEVGDTNVRFTIQSASKPLVLGLALADMGREAVLQKVGVEPTGDAFNSMVKLDGANRPHNPMINAGAIACSGLITGSDPTLKLNRIIESFSDYAGRPLDVDMSVFTSERSTGHRNRSMAHLMLNFGMIGPDIEETLDLYFKQCSVLTTARDLAVMGATLANGGINPVTSKQVLPREYIQDLLSIMLTCGMYDYAGEWAYRVGLPAKSGVGGGIIAVVPGKLGIGLFSPRLDPKGNSVRGVKAATDMSTDLGLHCLSCDGQAKLDDLLKSRHR